MIRLCAIARAAVAKIVLTTPSRRESPYCGVKAVRQSLILSTQLGAERESADDEKSEARIGTLRARRGVMEGVLGRGWQEREKGKKKRS